MNSDALIVFLMYMIVFVSFIIYYIWHKKHVRYIENVYSRNGRYLGTRIRYVDGKCIDCYYGYKIETDEYPCNICKNYDKFNKAIFIDK